MAEQIKNNEYDVLNEAVTEYLNEGSITVTCPRCGKPLIYETFGSLEVIRCEDKACIKSIRRGI